MCRWMLRGFTLRGRVRRPPSSAHSFPVAYQGKQLSTPDLRAASLLLLYNPR